MNNKIQNIEMCQKLLDSIGFAMENAYLRAISSITEFSVRCFLRHTSALLSTGLTDRFL